MPYSNTHAARRCAACDTLQTEKPCTLTIVRTSGRWDSARNTHRYGPSGHAVAPPQRGIHYKTLLHGPHSESTCTRGTAVPHKEQRPLQSRSYLLHGSLQRQSCTTAIYSVALTSDGKRSVAASPCKANSMLQVPPFHTLAGIAGRNKRLCTVGPRQSTKTLSRETRRHRGAAMWETQLRNCTVMN